MGESVTAGRSESGIGGIGTSGAGADRNGSALELDSLDLPNMSTWSRPRPKISGPPASDPGCGRAPELGGGACGVGEPESGRAKKSPPVLDCQTGPAAGPPRNAPPGAPAGSPVGGRSTPAAGGWSAAGPDRPRAGSPVGPAAPPREAGGVAAGPAAPAAHQGRVGSTADGEPSGGSPLTAESPTLPRRPARSRRVGAPPGGVDGSEPGSPAPVSSAPYPSGQDPSGSPPARRRPERERRSGPPPGSSDSGGTVIPREARSPCAGAARRSRPRDDE
jgi:hypothetical protein